MRGPTSWRIWRWMPEKMSSRWIASRLGIPQFERCGKFMAEMTPREVVAALDKYIIGQAAAKRAVAVAIRNRWRRLQLPEGMREEVGPKNILMIGPTGVGKTE